METHTPSRHVLILLIALVPAMIVSAGCGSASRLFSGLGTASTDKEAELASHSEHDTHRPTRNAVPENDGEVVQATYEQEQSAQPEVAVASASDQGVEVRLASHSEAMAAAPTTHSERRVPGKVEHIDTSDFTQHVLQSDVPVLVDFYADWCGPCRALTPTLDRIARDTPNARVVKVNIDESPQVARKYGVKSIPTVMVFKNGSAVARHTGMTDERSLLQMLAQ